jgi:hypothetical protein
MPNAPNGLPIYTVRATRSMILRTLFSGKIGKTLPANLSLGCCEPRAGEWPAHNKEHLMPLIKKKSTIKTLSYDEVLAKLESAKREFKEFDKGQRKALYQSMQRAAEAAWLVKADETIESRYRQKMGEKDVLYAALIFIFDAKSTDKKKEASKRAGALWYLIVKQGISVEGIAKAIPEYGGIEKLARLAAKSREDEADEDEDDEDQKDEDQGEPEEADENDNAEHNFGKLINVGLSPKLTTKLIRFPDKTRIKIIGYVRISPDESPTIEATKIVELVSKKEAETKKAVTKKEAVSKKKGGKSKPKSAAKKTGDDDEDDDVSDWD